MFWSVLREAEEEQPVTDMERRKAAKEFSAFWKGKGYEKGERSSLKETWRKEYNLIFAGGGYI